MAHEVIFFQHNRLNYSTKTPNNNTILFNFSANRQPVVNILGPSFASLLEKEGANTDELSLIGEGEDEDQGRDSEVKVRLFLLLQNLDTQLLSKCLKEISE